MTSLTQLDVRALLALYGGNAGAWGPVMIAFTVLGSGWTTLLLVPALVRRSSRRFAVCLSLSIVVQAVLVWTVKAIVGRDRPWVALVLPPPFGEPRDPSFPSGHAAGSFCVAAFLAVALPDVWATAPLRARGIVAAVGVLAAFVAASRVYLGAHFPGDVLCGAVLGAWVGVVGARLYLRGSSVRRPDRPVVRAPERG